MSPSAEHRVPIRRALVTRLARGEATVGELGEPFDRLAAEFAGLVL